MIDFERRLISLKERRQGSRERVLYEELDRSSADVGVLTGKDVRQKESYEQLQKSAGIRYAIGSMAKVDEKSTQVSIREGERVASNVVKGLITKGESVEARLQGSVALDIHIKGHSDVDMLVLLKDPYLIEVPIVDPSSFTPSSDQRSCVDIVKEIRLSSESLLRTCYPAATINTNGNKSIAIEGGSLLRKVDIVPAVWFDTIKYQESPYEFNRGVKIYHKGNHELLLNHPFKHIAFINARDDKYNGNVKRVARLLKNMIADMPDYKKKTAKNLSSYDLAAVAYAMDSNLEISEYLTLGLVERTREYLTRIKNDGQFRNRLNVPDSSRKIFDNANKVDALEILAQEVTDLTIAIFKEIEPYKAVYDGSKLLYEPVVL